MEGVLVTEELRWCRHIPCLDKLQGLYLEFVYLDARVLSKMANLRELRLLFDQWEVAHLEVLAQLPTLQTLYLEPATPNALSVEVRYLCVTGQGSYSSMCTCLAWLCPPLLPLPHSLQSPADASWVLCMHMLFLARQSRDSLHA